MFCKVAEDGSVAIPPEALTALGASPGAVVCLEPDGDAIVLHIVAAVCELCGMDHDLIEANGYYFCRDCAEDLVRSLETQKT